MEGINLKDKTLEDLRYIAKMLGLKSITRLRKSELIEKFTNPRGLKALKKVLSQAIQKLRQRNQMIVLKRKEIQKER